MKRIKILFFCLMASNLLGADATQFLTYTQNQVNSNILGNVQGLVSLNGYSTAVQNELSTSLGKSILSNSLTVELFKKQVNSSFVNGFKSEAIKEINANPLLSAAQKQDLINSMKDVNSITGVKNLLSLENFNLKQLDSLVDKAASLEEAQMRTLNSFDCACVAPLTSAFKEIERHIIDDNLTPLNANLTTLIETIKNNTKTASEQTPYIEKSNKYYAAKIVEAQEHLHKIGRAHV